jgi:hypothetical protein
VEVFVQSNNFDKIEFRFLRFGGYAKGRFAILIFAALIVLAMISTLVLFLRASSVGVSYYDHLDGPHLRAMTTSVSPSLKGRVENTHRLWAVVAL